MNCKIEVNDCVDALERLEDGTVGLAFADPPFNLEKDYTSYEDNLLDDKYENWSAKWIAELIRVLRPGGSLLLHNIPMWLVRYSCIIKDHNNMQFRHWIAWDAPTSPMGTSLQPAHYGIIYYVKKSGDEKKPLDGMTFHELRCPHKRCRDCKVIVADYGGKKDTIPPHGPLVSDAWKELDRPEDSYKIAHGPKISDFWQDIHRIKHKKNRNNHPCQLPVHLLERIVLMSSEPGDLVVDPFSGAGTTAVACARLDRNFVGFDIEPDYVAIGQERVARQKQKSALAGIYVSSFRKELHTVREDDLYDHETKQFRESWKNLFEEWPDTKEKRKKLNKDSLRLKREYANILSVLDDQLKEPTHVDKETSVDAKDDILS